MGPEGAVNIIYREELNSSEDSDSLRSQLIKDYEDRFTNPYVAANRGYLDDVIDPAETRPHIIKSLEMLQNKRDSMPGKKHGNMPL